MILGLIMVAYIAHHIEATGTCPELIHDDIGDLFCKEVGEVPLHECCDHAESGDAILVEVHNDISGKPIKCKFMHCKHIDYKPINHTDGIQRYNAKPVIQNHFQWGPLG